MTENNNENSSNRIKLIIMNPFEMERRKVLYAFMAVSYSGFQSFNYYSKLIFENDNLLKTLKYSQNALKNQKKLTVFLKHISYAHKAILKNYNSINKPKRDYDPALNKPVYVGGTNPKLRIESDKILRKFLDSGNKIKICPEMPTKGI